MLIAYDNLFQLDPEAPYGEKTRLMASNSGHSKGILISLDTSEFRVDYKEGKAEIHLSRHMTTAEARRLAEALVKAADQNDENEKAWQQSIQVNG